jgi:hypothetical protein
VQVLLGYIFAMAMALSKTVTTLDDLNERVNVGPVYIGESMHSVHRKLGSVQPIVSGKSRILCYYDNQASILLQFDDGMTLNKVVINGRRDEGDCGAHSARIPARYSPIANWKWAGGAVSRPPDASSLRRAGNEWIPPGVIDGFWHFSYRGCHGSIVYDNFGVYGLQLGPFSCSSK